MDFQELSRQIADALVSTLAVIDQRQAEQRSRWFKCEDDKHIEIRETYTIAGHEVELPICGIERPSRLDIDVIEADLDSDSAIEKKDGVFRIITRMFSGNRNRGSVVTIRVKLKQAEPSEGLMALHKRAANEIKDITHSITPVTKEAEN